MKKIGFFGNFENAFLGLINDYEISFVIFEKEKENNNIADYCSTNSIDYIAVESREDIKDYLETFSDIDFFIVASFGIIFDEKILEYPRLVVINIHPGILPQYRGRHPLPQAILNKEKYMGLTSHVMSLEIDKGKILKISKLRIDYKKSYKENEKRLLSLLSDFVQESIRNYMNKKEIILNEIENYYKPLDKMKLNNIFSVKQLKDMA